MCCGPGTASFALVQFSWLSSFFRLTFAAHRRKIYVDNNMNSWRALNVDRNYLFLLGDFVLELHLDSELAIVPEGRGQHYLLKLLALVACLVDLD